MKYLCFWSEQMCWHSAKTRNLKHKSVLQLSHVWYCKVKTANSSSLSIPEGLILCLNVRCVMCACMCSPLPLCPAFRGCCMQQSKSQRLLARPAASAGLHVSVSEVVHCTLFSLWLRKSSDCLLCLLKWNIPMVPPSLPQALYTETFPGRLCMFTGVWQIYSSLMDHNSTKVSLQNRLIFHFEINQAFSNYSTLLLYSGGRNVQKIHFLHFL